MVLQYACKFFNTPSTGSKESVSAPSHGIWANYSDLFTARRWLSRQSQLTAQPKARINCQTHSTDASQRFQPPLTSHSQLSSTSHPPQCLSLPTRSPRYHGAEARCTLCAPSKCLSYRVHEHNKTAILCHCLAWFLM